jgi:hypothetical protein
MVRASYGDDGAMNHPTCRSLTERLRSSFWIRRKANAGPASRKKMTRQANATAMLRSVDSSHSSDYKGKEEPCGQRLIAEL